MQPEQAIAHVPVRRIQPSRGAIHLDLPETWRFRELLYFLIWRDIKSRYRQTVLGTFWAIARPFISMVIFTIIFGHLAGIKTGSSLPYPLFVYPALLVWTYFGSALSGGSSSVLGNGSLISKAYFPRLYIPAAAVLAPLVDFALALVVLFGVFAWYQRLPSWHIVFLPFFLGLTILTSLGLSLWLGALTVRYRDVPFALPFVIQIWLYATPVIYPTSLIPKSWQWLIALNPLAGVVTGTRWSLVGGGAPSALYLGTSIGIGLALLAGGFVYFRLREPSFPDHV